MKLVTRRSALQLIGAGLGALSGACGPEDDPRHGAGPQHDAGSPAPDDDAGFLGPDVGHDADAPGPTRDAALPDAGPSDLDADAAHDASTPPPSPEQLLGTIDTIVVLVMENRSFDHMLGALRMDAAYPGRERVDGLRGDETNLSASGEPVAVFKMDNFTPEDPPHGWDAVHAQWNGGLNDGFVKAHAGASEREAMGYHDRSQIPFYYWLADNFTVCDRWFCSVLGPTWPNRYYIHAASSNGKQDNAPGNEPERTIWSELKAGGQSFKNYFDGPVPWYLGGFLGKLLTLNPAVGIADFFADARAGTLPNFCLIDPDFTANDDHPSHDIMRGQAFVASVYRALAESPQWSRCLFVITYDEHGGFYDHVPPPATDDDHDGFQQLGFRVPAIVVGPTVRRGFVNSQTLEHASVAATLRTRFGIGTLSRRMAAANDLATCIDPDLYQNPAPPPLDAPPIVMSRQQALHQGVGHSSQPQLEALVANGAIPAELVDTRPASERIRAWLAHGEHLGAVRLVD